MIDRIDIHAYFVKDMDRAERFYRETLGLRRFTGDNSRGVEFQLPDGSTFGLYQPQPGDGIEEWKKCYGIMFGVDDARGTVAELRRRGVQIADPLEGPVCFMAFGEDSEGNQLIVHQRK